jgi:hypothetical protein
MPLEDQLFLLYLVRNYKATLEISMGQPRDSVIRKEKKKKKKKERDRKRGYTDDPQATGRWTSKQYPGLGLGQLHAERDSGEDPDHSVCQWTSPGLPGRFLDIRSIGTHCSLLLNLGSIPYSGLLFPSFSLCAFGSTKSQ